MATEWISPTWRMPENSNQSKVDNYSLSFNGTDEYIDLTQHDLGTVNSISFWLKRANTDAVDETILENQATLLTSLLMLVGVLICYIIKTLLIIKVYGIFHHIMIQIGIIIRLLEMERQQFYMWME